MTDIERSSESPSRPSVYEDDDIFNKGPYYISAQTWGQQELTQASTTSEELVTENLISPNELPTIVYQPSSDEIQPELGPSGSSNDPFGSKLFSREPETCMSGKRLHFCLTSYTHIVTACNLPIESSMGADGDENVPLTSQRITDASDSDDDDVPSGFRPGDFSEHESNSDDSQRLQPSSEATTFYAAQDVNSRNVIQGKRPQQAKSRLPSTFTRARPKISAKALTRRFPVTDAPPTLPNLPRFPPPSSWVRTEGVRDPDTVTGSANNHDGSSYPAGRLFHGMMSAATPTHSQRVGRSLRIVSLPDDESDSEGANLHAIIAQRNLRGELNGHSKEDQQLWSLVFPDMPFGNGGTLTYPSHQPQFMGFLEWVNDSKFPEPIRNNLGRRVLTDKSGNPILPEKLMWQFLSDGRHLAFFKGSHPSIKHDDIRIRIVNPPEEVKWTQKDHAMSNCFGRWRAREGGLGWIQRGLRPERKDFSKWDLEVIDRLSDEQFTKGVVWPIVNGKMQDPVGGCLYDIPPYTPSPRAVRIQNRLRELKIEAEKRRSTWRKVKVDEERNKSRHEVRRQTLNRQSAEAPEPPPALPPRPTLVALGKRLASTEAEDESDFYDTRPLKKIPGASMSNEERSLYEEQERAVQEYKALKYEQQAPSHAESFGYDNSTQAETDAAEETPLTHNTAPEGSNGFDDVKKEANADRK
ncbi:MAG: hypothetical protein M1820_000206 [Bogoriella megaspora]|nr:MAG: hypothetical protein M1820_000206 [Bogoriella megaspora]